MPEDEVDMTDLPPDEIKALGHIEPGANICELGNKKNVTGLYRDWYERIGCQYVCVDWNGEDGAVPLDMRYNVIPQDVLDFLELDLDHPLRRAQHGFDHVTNLGFTEHVTDQEAVWRNIHNLVKKGGVVSCCLPFPFSNFKLARPNWEEHGFWQPTIKWMELLANENDYRVHFISVWRNRVRPTLISRWWKIYDKPFVWIDEPMHRTKLKMGQEA